MKEWDFCSFSGLIMFYGIIYLSIYLSFQPLSIRKSYREEI
jgi:hypothetical protein